MWRWTVFRWGERIWLDCPLLKPTWMVYCSRWWCIALTNSVFILLQSHLMIALTCSRSSALSPEFVLLPSFWKTNVNNSTSTSNREEVGKNLASEKCTRYYKGESLRNEGTLTLLLVVTKYLSDILYSTHIVCHGDWFAWKGVWMT